MLKFDDLVIKKINEEDLEDGALRSTFEIAPLPRGYGHTLGTSLRRALLSSVPGYAITGVRVNNLDHEFSTIPGVLENVLDIVLRLQKVRFSVAGSNPSYVISLNVKGVKDVKAKDFDVPSDVKVVNKSLKIATLTDKSAELFIEATLKRSIGFKIANDEKRNEEPGFIPLDAVFSPVRLVEYEVMSTRKGAKANLDKVVMSVETDGSITPEEAVKYALNTLMSFYNTVVEKVGRIDEVEIEEETSEATAVKEEVAGTDIGVLGLSGKLEKALREKGINTIEELVTRTRGDIEALKGIGVKTVDQLEEKLKSQGYNLSK